MNQAIAETGLGTSVSRGYVPVDCVEISANRCSSCSDGDEVIDDYIFSSERYAYGRFSSHYREDERHRGFDGEAYLRRYYDSVNPFSSGISSYQGTSTGPGPNGGYPGSPRGVYKTIYKGR